MTVLLASFFYCLLSAVAVVLPAEVYVVGVALATDVAPGWLALAAALGQVAGKMLYYLVGRGVLDVARLRRRGTAGGRWAQRMTTVERWCEEHVWGPSAVTLVSAFAGLPPYAIVSVLAGSVRMRWWLFALLSVLGRFARFWAILQVPHLLPDALFGL
ncbi:YqaA family protein [Georgenia subflava]|uniref:VTT domain-containing protein n=1 Tax=Georgenia subflava TaxID=1622177 RepID=A0A6N7EDW2_9MICO|nr:VTT domain-containing protein [Georgenia subflava]MPV36602.1 hypothetical protein [Georgenia subflava]